ncbi:hypothetical protein GDO81_022717, partial [Engystomops pustulosus]
ARDKQIAAPAVLDRFLRALPGEIQQWVGHGDLSDAEALVGLVERFFATQALTKKAPYTQAGPKARKVVSPTFSRGKTTPNVWDVPQGRRRGEALTCWTCHEPGHIAAHYPNSSEPMDCSSARRVSLYAAPVYTATSPDSADELHLCRVTVAGHPALALLDSGSRVTLINGSLIDPKTVTGRTIGVLCIHGDVKDYSTTVINFQTSCGETLHEAAVVMNLPHDLILGRDFPMFWTLWRGNQELVVCSPVLCGQISEPEPDDPDSGVPAVGVTATEDGSVMFPLDVMAGETEEVVTGPQLSDLEVSRDNFGTAQLQDPTLVRARENVAEINGVPQHPGADKLFPRVVVNQELLYRIDKVHGETREQLMVPQPYRQMVLDLAHKHVMGGHLGTTKTLERILQRFYLPGVYDRVKRYCETCPDCQLHAPMVHFRSPLVPLPIIEVPFERVAMDLVGPLVKSARGHQHILVVMDYATRYPEAIPLRHTSAKLIAKELFAMFCRVGLPKEILTDQGTPFMSKVTKELCRLFNIKQLRTSVYHSQTDGLVERFNKTLKSMLKKVVNKDGKDWDVLLPYLMFVIREVPQASTGFSPFELVYGRHPRGLLDIAKETWEQEPTPHKSVIDHISDMQDRVAAVMPIVKEHMEEAQITQSRVYNRSAKVRTFNPGDRVLVLVPTVESKFLAKWQGPYEVIEKIGEVNYRIRQPGRRKPEQTYHVNLLKAWKDGESLHTEMVLASPPPAIPSQAADKPVPEAEVRIADSLTKEQQREAREFVARNTDVFSELPGYTSVIKHDIVTEPGVK